MSRPTILQLLAHGPATAHELRMLAGLNRDELLAQVNALMYPERLIAGHRNTWHITEKGHKTLALAYEQQRRQALDAACEGAR